MEESGRSETKNTRIQFKVSKWVVYITKLLINLYCCYISPSGELYYVYLSIICVVRYTTYLREQCSE